MPNGGSVSGGKAPNGGHASIGVPQAIVTNNPLGGQPGVTPPQPAPQSQADSVNTGLTLGSYSKDIRPIA